jgi:hypothetical protein
MWGAMYFNELIAILDAHWNVFEAWFSASRENALAWLREVNQGRIDAHAGEMSVEQLAYLRLCLRRIEERLDLVGYQ